LITGSLPVDRCRPPPSTRLVRSWRQVDRIVLRQAIVDSPLGQSLYPDVTSDELFTVYDQTLRNIADRLAPEHVVQSQVRRQCPWFDADCRHAPRHCRRLERRYIRTRHIFNFVLNKRDQWHI